TYHVGYASVVISQRLLLLHQRTIIAFTHLLVTVTSLSNLFLMSNLTDPAWLDKGDNAWQLTSSSLVGLQSVPGLVILYGGIVKRKWAINSAFMAFYAFQAVLITWILWAYKMGFGEQWAQIGRAHV